MPSADAKQWKRTVAFFKQLWNSDRSAITVLWLHGSESGVMDLSDPGEALAALQQTDNAICAICSCDVTSVNNPEGSNPGRFTACSHLLCNSCFFQYEEDLKMNRNGESSYCPICRELVSGGDEELSPSTKDRGQSYMINPNLINTGQATKLSKLFQDVRGVSHSAKRLVENLQRNEIS